MKKFLALLLLLASPAGAANMTNVRAYARTDAFVIRGDLLPSAGSFNTPLSWGLIAGFDGFSGTSPFTWTLTIPEHLRCTGMPLIGLNNDLGVRTRVLPVAVYPDSFRIEVPWDALDVRPLLLRWRVFDLAADAACKGGGEVRFEGTTLAGFRLLAR